MGKPLPFVWPYALLFWVAYVWAFWPELAFMKRARKLEVPRADAGSLRVVLAGMQVALVISFVVAFFVPQSAHRISMFFIGVVLLILGSALRRHCFRVLGEYFTFAVTVQNDQPVIERGAYRWIRHPSYTGGMLMFGGVGLALGNWLSFAVMLGTTILVYAYRVIVEERALVATIGEPYRAYMARRKRFIPFVI